MQELFSRELDRATSAITYGIHRALSAYAKPRFVMESNAFDFNVEAFARAGHCVLEPSEAVHGENRALHVTDAGKVFWEAVNSWVRVSWKDESLELVTATVYSDCGEHTHRWLIAPSRTTAEAFFIAVMTWAHELRDEIFVFRDGCWHKSKKLYRAVRATTLESLILRAELKRDITHDLETFIASRDIYEAHGVPWKRGVLFTGPPGNGKTHCVKALLNHLDITCLYVQNLKQRYDTEHAAIRDVFTRARRVAPCILVFEDLDSLVTDDNRSVFLNELDGFAANHGVVVLATTNFPERLDPAILDRPSRFDMKYEFALPEAAERARYARWWNGRVSETMRVGDEVIDRVAERTEGFSYAYLKELWMSAIMTWINDRNTPMSDVLSAQIPKLRAQTNGKKRACGYDREG